MLFNKLKPIALALSAATLTMASCSAFAGGPLYKISINEFYRSGNLTTTNEWAEVVLLQDLTAAQLETYFVGDSTGSTAAKFSSYQFTNMAAIAPTFCAGTIITVGGTTGPAADAAYDPAANDWNLSLQTDGANITSTTGGGNFAGNDVVYIDTVDTGNTLTADGFAINWDSTPGAFGSAATFTLTNSPNNNSGAFLNDTLSNAGIDASWTSDTLIGTLTPGAVNGGANTTSIQTLQAAALGTVTISGTPSANEGNAGTTTYTFTVTRTASCVAASIDFAVTGTGANPADAADFGGTLPTGTVNFAAGATTGSITINVSGDTTVEPDEMFLVTLSNPSGVALGATVTDTGTITNDDVVAANISIDDVAIVEGNAGTTTLDFTVSIDVTANATVQVDTSDATATTADSDYVAIAAQTVTFTNGGALTQTVSVTINGDTVIEADETFNVDLTNAVGATITDAQGVGTITNDDSASFSIDDVNIVEGNAGTSLLNFTVSKAGNAAATIDWATSDGTATTADNDYVAVAATTLNFTAAQTTQTVSVTINGDTVIEADETFNVDLTNATGGATITDALGVGTITNDDSVQAILSAIKSVSGDLRPNGIITYTIAITNTGPNAQNDNPGDEMIDTLPASLTYVSASATSGTVSNVGNIVSWNGSVAAGATETVTIAAQVNSGVAGSIENTAIVSYDNDGDNTNESTAASASPTAVGPTAFFIPFMVPSLSQFALLLLMLSLVSVVYFKTKQRN
jgi:uncharacterized repeat protein (TIGR01451 family)